MIDVQLCQINGRMNTKQLEPIYNTFSTTRSIPETPATIRRVLFPNPNPKKRVRGKPLEDAKDEGIRLLERALTLIKEADTLIGCSEAVKVVTAAIQGKGYQTLEQKIDLLLKQTLQTEPQPRTRDSNPP